MMKRIVALLLTVLLLVQSVPSDVLANDISAESAVEISSSAEESSALEEEITDSVVEPEPALEPESSEEVTPEPEADPVPEEESEPTDAPTEETQTVTVEANETTIEKTVCSADGTSYTVKVKYDDAAEIPEGTELSIKELVQQPTEEELKKPENADRPYASEEFVSEKALTDKIALLTKGLDLEKADRLYYTKFLDLSLTSGGRAVELKAPVEITIETKDMDVSMSDGVEICQYDPEAAREEDMFAPLKVENRTGLTDKDEKIDRPDTVALRFSTDRLDQIALAGVAARKLTWTVYDRQVSVYGPRSLETKAYSAPGYTAEAGKWTLAAFTVKTAPSRDFKTTLWIDSADTGAVPEGYYGSVSIDQVKNGTLQAELLGAAGGTAHFKAGDQLALVWDSGYQTTTLTKMSVTLEGLLPADTEAKVSDVTDAYAAALETMGEAAGDRTVIAAYDITLTSEGREYQPGSAMPVTVSIRDAAIAAGEPLEVWHVMDAGTLEWVSGVQVEDGKVTFEAKGFSVYVVTGYTVDFTYEGFTYNLSGGQGMLLSELLEALGIEADLTGSNAYFSDDMPAGLVELTPIKDRDDVHVVNWSITSLQPFDTEHTLTVETANGRTYVIGVTDAVTLPVSGTWSNGSNGSGEWSVDENGVMTISGTGKINDFNGVTDAPWGDYDLRKAITRVVITDGITHLGKNMLTRAWMAEIDASACTTLVDTGTDLFKQSNYGGESPQNNKLTTVNFAGNTNFTGFGGNAFSGCTAITTVDISNTKMSSLAAFDPSKTKIQTLKANGCTSFRNALNLSGHTAIRTLELSGCTGLTSVTLPSSVVTVNLSGCSNAGFTTLDLSNHTNLTTLDLSGCTSLTSLNLTNCSSLTSLTPPASVTSLTLDGCTGLRTLDLSGCASLTSPALSGLTSLTSLTLPAGATGLSLTGCTGLQTLDLSGCTNLTTLNLTNCSSLTALTPPAGVTGLTLTGCTGLRTLDLSACTGLTAPDLSGCSGLTEVTLPGTITGLTLPASPSSLTTIRYDGNIREWDRFVEASGIVIPEGVTVIPLREIPDSDSLNDFVDAASTYTVRHDGTETEAASITTPAILDSTSDPITMRLHFAEAPGAQMKMPEGTENPVLYYTLPDNVTVAGCDTPITLTVPGYPEAVFTGVLSEETGSRIRLEWLFEDHTDEEIEAFLASQSLAFTIALTVRAADLPASIELGNDLNSLILRADTPHNPKVVRKEAGEYDPSNKTVTFTVEITAEGDVDNNGQEYPVVINDTMGSALSFASGTYTYTSTETGYAVKDKDGSPLNEAFTDSPFPITVEHMHDGDTITLTYTVNVATDEIAINGSPTAEEAGNLVELTNTGNPYNKTGDDEKYCLPDLLFPELKTTVEKLPSDDEDALPVYRFTTYVSALTDQSVTDATLVIENILDADEDGNMTANAGLWKLCGGELEPSAQGMARLTDTESQTISLGTNTGTDGQVTFTLSDLKQGNGENYWGFYRIVYCITPKDDAAVSALRDLAVAGNPVGEHKFTSSTGITSGTASPYGRETEEYTYQYMPVRKSLVRMDGNWAYYEITVNPDRMTLNGGGTMTLKDTFYDQYGSYGYRNQYSNYVSQSIDYYSIEVAVEGVPDASPYRVSYDYSGYTGTFRVPDGTLVTVTYRTRVSGKSGSQVTFINDAVLSGGADFTAHNVNTRFIYPGGDDILEKDGNYIKLFKYASGHMEEGLAGARFILLDASQQPVKYQKGAQAGEEIIFTTGNGDNGLKKGYVKIALDELTHGVSLQKNKVYYLEEVVAPVGEDGDGNSIYYKKDSTLYSFVISDNPNYKTGDDSIYTYFNGDVLKVRNYEAESGIFVDKRFTGNYSLTDAEKSNITFTLEIQTSVDGEGNPVWEPVTCGGQPDVLRYSTLQKTNEVDDNGSPIWVDVAEGEELPEGTETRYNSNFPYGYAQFMTGKKVKTGEDSEGNPIYGIPYPVEAGATYRIVETNAAITDPAKGVDLRTNWIVTKASDEEPQTVPDTGDSVTFTVEAEDLGTCIDVLCDNKYVLNKLTIRKVDEEDGKPLPGAKFSVYNYAKQSFITEYTTCGEESDDDDAKGFIEITRTIAGGFTYDYDTLYYAMETEAPEGYILPEESERERIYFYFSSPDSTTEFVLPSGVQSAVDLSESYAEVSVPNKKSITDVPVLKVWALENGASWPEGVDHVTVGLYRSANGAEAVPVTDEDGDPRVVRLTEATPYREDFEKLTTQDSAGNRITYSVRELGVYADPEETENLLDQYSPAYSVTDSGVYVVKNAEGVSIRVVKKWYDETSGEEITAPGTLSQLEPVSYDIFRSVRDVFGEVEAVETPATPEEPTTVDLDLYLYSATNDGSSMTVTLGSGDTITAPSTSDQGTKVNCDYLKNLSLDDTVTVVINSTSANNVQFTRSKNWKGAVHAPEAANEADPFINTVSEYVSIASEAGDIPLIRLCNYYGEATVSIIVTKASSGTDPTITYVTHDVELTRAEIEAKLADPDAGLELVEAGLTLGNDDGWQKTIGSLARYDSEEQPYYYYVLETKTEELTDAYTILPGETPRQLVIKNSGNVKPICKVDGNVFFTLNAAMDYITEYELQRAVIEMLLDYVQPQSDALTIPSGYDITLTTASLEGTEEDPYHYEPPEDAPDRTEAVISRYGTFTDLPMITNRGMLTLRGVTLDGSKPTPEDPSVLEAARAMVESEGTLIIGEKAVLQNASHSTGNGGAVYVSAGTVTVEGGALRNNEANRGGAIFSDSAGAIIIQDKSGETEDDPAVISAITGNQAYQGGAIFSGSGAAITLSGGTQITDNHSVDGGSGGAIYAAGGSITVQDSVLLSENTSSSNGGAIYTDMGVVTVSGGSFAENSAHSNGGAIYSKTGTVTVSDGQFSGNAAENSDGGAVYMGSGTVYLSAGALTGNSAYRYGGAFYLDSGTMYVTGGTIGGAAQAADDDDPDEPEEPEEPDPANRAANGAAIYTASGAITFSDSAEGTYGVITGNISGHRTIETIDETTGETVTTYAATGGAVGVGSESARLYFSGNIQISGNLFGPEDDRQASNVYLNQNSDMVINSRGLGVSAAIGVHVPDDAITVTDDEGHSTETTLANLRGVPGCKFGSYVSTDNYAKFTNDRLEVKCFTDVSTQKLMWGKEIQVELRYQASYQNGFPSKTNGAWTGTKKYGPAIYNPKISSGAISVLAEDLYANGKGSDTSAFGGAYAEYPEDSDPNNERFVDYFTHIEWDSDHENNDDAHTHGAWKLIKKNGDTVIKEVYPSKIIIYYTEPAYISIQNNTNFSESPGEEPTQRTFTIDELTVNVNGGISAISTGDVPGYGYVVSKDGATRSALLPLTEEDLELAPGGSIKLMIPGGCKKNNTANSGMPFTLKGSFVPAESDGSIMVFYTDGTEGKYESESKPFSEIRDPGLSYSLLKNYGETFDVIFESRKPVCKIVQAQEVTGETGDTEEAFNQRLKDNKVLLYQETEGLGHEYLFASIADAVAFTEAFSLTVPWQDPSDPDAEPSDTVTAPGAVIEMLLDYLLPMTDQVNLQSGYQYTFTTAKKPEGIEDGFYYTGEGRAVISRDSGNKNSLITYEAAEADMAASFLTIHDLDFDGKNLAGNSDGGAIKTRFCGVEMCNADFKNFIAANGGAVFVEYGDVTDKQTYEFKKELGEDFVNNRFQYATMTVTDCNFDNCVSSSTKNRQGGGAIWTNAKTLRIEGTVNEDGTVNYCNFDNCVADDQGGAVFHRMDDYYAGTSTTLINCIVRGSTARAAGGMETDTSSVEVRGCKFYNCTATQRNGGGFNVYSNNSATTDKPSTVTVSDCYFENCHADSGVNSQPAHGGGMRSAALVTTVTNTKFNKCSSLRGGGGASSNSKGGSMTVIDGVTMNNCSALYTTNSDQNTKESGRGGGIYCMTSSLCIDCTQEGNTYPETGNETSVANCISGQEGGGIYHGGGSRLQAVNCSVTGSTSGTAGTANTTGGGIHTAAGTVVLKDCTVRDNTAVGKGGGVYQSGKTRITVDQSIIAGNTAGDQGGGVYTAAQVTLQNDTYILSNTLAGGTALDGAGLYTLDGKTITVGASGRTVPDATTVKDNYTAGGLPSDLRLSETANADGSVVNSTNSVYVQCGLSGEILVVNAAAKQCQFGSSKIDSPAGFTDLKHVFKADDGSLFGIVDRNDTKKLIWAGDPICKITDDKGNMLYFKDGGSAIFDSLDVANATADSSRNAAFSMLRYSNVELYTDTAHTSIYNGTTYCVKMLVPEYTVRNPILTTTVTGREIILTTAGAADSDGYIYSGDVGTHAKIIRGGDVGNSSLITANNKLTLQNIYLDGGAGGAGITADTDTRNILVNSGALVTLGRNALVQNASVTGGNGGGVYVAGGSLVMDGGTIQSCTASDGNGGGVYVAAEGGLNVKEGSVIQSCAAENGGAVYTCGANTALSGGSVTSCWATDSGGGVYIAENAVLNMSGGSVTSCGKDGHGTVQTRSGGGVYAADGAALNMSGGRIERSSAAEHGGGIAAGGRDDSTATLTFSGGAYVYNNTLDGSPCNVELDQNSNTIIHSAGLSETAFIGVYVTGEVGTEESLGTGNFAIHGNKGQPFGAWTNSDNLKCFSNDRNNLRGGLMDGDENIHWIQIYFLKVSKQVLSTESADNTKEFHFHVALTQKEGASITDIEGNPVRIDEIDSNERNGWKYGQIPFIDGVADFTLKSGESLQAENLPDGLEYTVTEVLVEDEYGVTLGETERQDNRKFTTLPNDKDDLGNPVIHGEVGKDENGRTNYLSLAAFTNIHAVCKITSNPDAGDSVLLYYRVGNSYEPAVYMHVYQAFDTINRSRLYYMRQDPGTGLVKPTTYGGSFNVEMLVAEYSITNADGSDSKPVALNKGYHVTLTTADPSAQDGYPYSGGNTTAAIKREYTGTSMMTVNGNLTLGKITLDGNQDEGYTCDNNGGLVRIGTLGQDNSQAKLTVTPGATLKDSKSSRDGGAVYANAGASVTMTGGHITGNECNGSGAGVYLAANETTTGTLYLSGGVDFGGTDLKGGTGSDKNDIQGLNGNFAAGSPGSGAKNGGKDYARARQDIYIADSSEVAAALYLTGELKDNGTVLDEGSIWVWAPNLTTENTHYQEGDQFALIDLSKLSVTDQNRSDIEKSLNVFRNARTDADSSGGTRGAALLGGFGETEGHIIWGTIGEDVSFMKRDGFGRPLAGAKFQLFETMTYDSTSKTVTLSTPTENEATSLDGNTKPEGYEGDTAPAKGTVFFPKVPAGVYYMQETNAGTTADPYPTTQDTGDKTVTWKNSYDGEHINTYIVLVGEANLTVPTGRNGVWSGVLSGIDVSEIDAQRGYNETTRQYERNYAIFLIDSKTGNATATPNIAKYGIMNISTSESPVILSKVDSSMNALSSTVSEGEITAGTFNLLRYDRTVVESGLSAKNGVFYVGSLPCGTYLVEEQSAPTGYKQPTHYMVFKIDSTGVHNETSTSTTKIIRESTKDDFKFD